MIHAVQVHHENGQELNIARWHQPLCSIVITHRDYSRYIKDALLSLLNQTYQNWECVVVDDCSAAEELDGVERVIQSLSDKRIRFLKNESNLGQILTFYVGLDNTRGEFVTVLDPDDRFGPTFLEEMIAAHLNETAFGPVVCCDQKLVKLDDGLITGTYRTHDLNLAPPVAPRQFGFSRQPAPPLLYFPPKHTGWVWTTTSALMFRRSVANQMRPKRTLAYKQAIDPYLAQGAHMLGGTLFLRKSLVYRGLHSSNEFITEAIYSMNQSKRRPTAEQWSPQCKRDVVEAIFANDAEHYFSAKFLREVLRVHFKGEEMKLLRQQCPRVAEILLSTPEKMQRPLKRFRAAVRKQLSRRYEQN